MFACYNTGMSYLCYSSKQCIQNNGMYINALHNYDSFTSSVCWCWNKMKIETSWCFSILNSFPEQDLFKMCIRDRYRGWYTWSYNLIYTLYNTYLNFPPSHRRKCWQPCSYKISIHYNNNTGVGTPDHIDLIYIITHDKFELMQRLVTLIIYFNIHYNTHTYQVWTHT